MGKKIKLDFGEFVRFLDERKNGYYDFYRTALIKNDKKNLWYGIQTNKIIN